MTKAKTVGQKRRGRPMLDGVRRQPNGQPSRIPKERQDEAMNTALSARARHTGETALDALKLPWMGTNAGRAIADAPDVAELWQVIKAIISRRETYLKRNDIPSDHAKTARIGAEERASTNGAAVEAITADLRTDAEKARDADRAWSAIVDALYAKNPLLIRYVERAVIHDEPGSGPLAAVLRFLRPALGM